MVREIWFEKSGWPEKKGGFIPEIHQKSGSRKVVDQEKKSEFAEPLFYTFLEKWLQNKWSKAVFAQFCIFWIFKKFSSSIFSWDFKKVNTLLGIGISHKGHDNR